MDKDNQKKEYQAAKISYQQMNLFGEGTSSPKNPVPSRKPVPSQAINPHRADTDTKPVSDNIFYEIDYEAGPFKGVGRFVPKPQKVEQREQDEIHRLFYIMREKGRSSYPRLGNTRIYDKREQQNNAYVFYQQAVFMKNFTDDYEGKELFSSYFPFYQNMSYEQLRTYFTWRTRVRSGEVEETSLSYAFLYVYEILNNIGITSPQEGLDQLVWFWSIFRVYNGSIDKYIIRWLKDYHIYYNLPQSFEDFVVKNRLERHYPLKKETKKDFAYFCANSKYDILHSRFYLDNNQKLVEECWDFIINRLRDQAAEKGILLDNSVFAPVAKQSDWQPFKGALFYSWYQQADRRVFLSDDEIYVCRNSRWEQCTVAPSDNSRQLVGYIMRQMECALRREKGYRFKLTADAGKVKHLIVGALSRAGLSIEAMINNAVSEFIREASRVVVSVDPEALSRIRQEAILTQEKLIVEEAAVEESGAVPQNMQQDRQPGEKEASQANLQNALPADDPWTMFQHACSSTELEALTLILALEPALQNHLKQLADKNGTMLEVLLAGINEKAMDAIGDYIIDDDLQIYEDYLENVKCAVK